MARVLRLARTVRYLTARQIIYRVVRRGPVAAALRVLVGPPWSRFSRAMRTRTPRARARSITPRTASVLRAAPAAPASLTADGLVLDGLPVESARGGDLTSVWGSTTAPLRAYRLHAHVFLAGPGSDPSVCDAAIRGYVQELASNPAAWATHPLSLRIVYWVRFLSLHAELPAAGDPRVVAALALQARHLSRSVEYETDGNHLIDNAAALVAAGWYLGDARLSTRGLRILRRELPRQILPDGMHVERSPMYHRMVVERVLDAFAVSGSAAARDAAARMMRWLARAPETDAALNDHFPGMAPTTEALSAYAERCGIVPTGGPTAGGARTANRAGIDRPAGAIGGRAAGGAEGGSPTRVSGARDSAEPGAHAAAPPTYPSATRGPFTVVFDVGNIGPDHVPGHAHADTLQVLLWYAGTPVLVDTGTSSYDDAEVRRYERGSAAHNTVHIGEDSSEMWGSFRVGRRARPLILHQATDGADIWRLSASHTGYTHLGVLHERAVELTPARVMVVDRLRPVRGGPLTRGYDPRRAPHSLPRAEAHWICAAGLTVTPVSGSTGAAAFRAGPIRFEFRGHRDVQLEYRPVAAGYEKRVETATLRVVFTNELETIIEPAT